MEHDLKFVAKYRVLVQKCQAGIKTLAEKLGDPKLYDAKHLRVGINNNIVELSAMIKLLVDKGILTTEEVEKAYLVAYEEEVTRLEREIYDKCGLVVKLDVPPGFQ